MQHRHPPLPPHLRQRRPVAGELPRVQPLLQVGADRHVHQHHGHALPAGPVEQVVQVTQVAAEPVGQREKLSPGDIASVNKLITM